jgi:hypothetical protein
MAYDNAFERDGNGARYIAREPNVSHSYACSGEVRWNDGRLQQRFIVTTYVASSPASQADEWRNVPTVTA